MISALPARLLVGLAATLAVLAFCAAVASAAPTSEGPRLAYVKEGQPLRGARLLTSDPLGLDPHKVFGTTNSSLGIGDLSWSPDGTSLAVGGFGFLPEEQIATILEEGGRPRPVSGTRGGFRPVFSPDGQTLAFARWRIQETREGKRPYFSMSTWLVDSEGGDARQLTPWRDGLFVVPASFAPDGTTLLVVRQTLWTRSSIVSMPLDGGDGVPIVKNGLEPEYSPDGSSLVFVRLISRRAPKRLGPLPLFGGDLFAASADGSTVRQLTFSPNRREEGPSWDPSGQRLAYTQYPAKATFEARTGTGSSIVEINADGTCRHRLFFTYGLSYRMPAWQPGPGRGAGRIEC